jgi:UDP-N-acetylmuramate dehydrogenase
MKLEIQEQVHLAPYTTFAIGGVSDYFVDVETESELRSAILFAQEQKVPFMIISGGSNILFASEKFNGLVIHITGGALKIYKDKVIADAGVSLETAIRTAAEARLSGWESLCGIPGSIGGAVRGNAGAFGTEIQDVLSKVRALNIQTGEVRDFTTKECAFDYRTSYFKTHPEWIVLTAVFKLVEMPEVVPEALINTCEETIAEREKRHLQDVQCAGSFFKNPVCTHVPEVIAQFEEEKGVKSKEGRVPAGWLIEKAGGKGRTVGIAISSKQHPNYIVNMAEVDAVPTLAGRDVLELRDSIKSSVQDMFDIILEEEVTIVQ